MCCWLPGKGFASGSLGERGSGGVPGAGGVDKPAFPAQSHSWIAILSRLFLGRVGVRPWDDCPTRAVRKMFGIRPICCLLFCSPQIIFISPKCRQQIGLKANVYVFSVDWFFCPQWMADGGVALSLDWLCRCARSLALDMRAKQAVPLHLPFTSMAQYSQLAIYAKPFEIGRNHAKPQIFRKPSIAPKNSRNAHWIDIKCHTKNLAEFHWVPLNFAEIFRISLNSHKFSPKNGSQSR